MRILYVTQWFEPEPAFKGAAFAESLSAHGHDVEVVTGFPNYPGGRLYPGYPLRAYRCDRTPGGLRVHRLFVFPSHDRSSARRALNYLSFFLSCLLFGLLRGWRYDVVYVYHPPLTPALAMALAAKLYRLRMVIDIQDLWPDSVRASGMASGRIVTLLDRLCQFVYHRTDHIVVQAEGMREKLVQRGVPADKLTRVYNWATYAPAAGPDAPATGPDELAEFDGFVNVVYGGNLGQAQALSHVVEAMEIARKAVPALRLHLFGNGIESDLLMRQARERPAANVVVHGSVERKRMDRIFDLADVLILHLKDDPLYDFTIPSKIQHYLACGKPVVAGLSGEAASILRESGAALVSPPEDSAGMAAALVALGKMDDMARAELGRRAREHYQRHFAMEAAIERTIGLLSGDPPIEAAMPYGSNELN